MSELIVHIQPAAFKYLHKIPPSPDFHHEYNEGGYLERVNANHS